MGRHPEVLKDLEPVARARLGIEHIVRFFTRAYLFRMTTWGSRQRQITNNTNLQIYRCDKLNIILRLHFNDRLQIYRYTDRAALIR